MKGLTPLQKIIFPPLLHKERGIKRVPRKIEDFSGCLKGVRFTMRGAKTSNLFWDKSNLKRIPHKLTLCYN